MANRRVGGILTLKIDGQAYNAKGAFTYDIGEPKRDAVVGADAVHGFKEMPKVPFIEGAITDTDALDTTALFRARDITATLQLANGKVIVVREGWYAGDGSVDTEEGEINFRIEGMRGEEII